MKIWKSSSFFLFKRSVQRSDVVDIISEIHLVTCTHFFTYDTITAVTHQSYMVFQKFDYNVKKGKKALRKLRHWLKLEQGFAQRFQKSCFRMINFSYKALFCKELKKCPADDKRSSKKTSKNGICRH